MMDLFFSHIFFFSYTTEVKEFFEEKKVNI